MHEVEHLGLGVVAALVDAVLGQRLRGAAAALVERREEPLPRADPLPLPVVHAESIPHPAAANQPAGPAGAPGAGSAVSWYGCDPNFANQPNQLWTYAPVAHRANGDASTPSALVNIGSVASSQTSMDVRTAPILAAAANQQGTNSALTLVAQPSATAANSSWHLTDVASS